jgi:hypothetical protein
MKTKLLVLLCWMFYYAVIQTADAVWLFFSIYSGILAICSFFYSLENKKPKPKKSK